MRDLGLLPAPAYIQNLDHSLLNYLDIQFRRIDENWRTLDSASPSGAAIPAGNVIAGTFGSNVGNGNYAFPGQLIVGTKLRIGDSPAPAYGSGYMSIDHTSRSYLAGGNYVLLADQINTFLNAPNGGGVFLRINNSTLAAYGSGGCTTYNQAGTELTVSDTNTFRSNYGLTILYQTPLYLRGYGDTNHRIIVPSVAPQYATNFNVDGPIIVGYNQWILATGNNGHWQACIGANFFQVFGALGVNNTNNNNIIIYPESITCDNYNSGVSFSQRTRGAGDAARRMVIYPSNDTTKYWIDGYGEHWVIGPVGSGIAYTSSAYIAVPALGGGNTLNLQVGGSWQIGYISSTKLHKKNIRPLRNGSENPIFKANPVKYNWKQASLLKNKDWKPGDQHYAHDGVANADVLNKLHPDGVAGLIAEEIMEIMPDAVLIAEGPEANLAQEGPVNPWGEHKVHDQHYAGQIIGLDNDRLIAYLIDAVIYLKEEVDILRWEQSIEPKSTSSATSAKKSKL